MSKTGVGGTLLAEAKYINVSLHCLEQVSGVSLHEFYVDDVHVFCLA